MYRILPDEHAVSSLTCRLARSADPVAGREPAIHKSKGRSNNRARLRRTSSCEIHNQACLDDESLEAFSGGRLESPTSG
jgi:hypothetical protein